MIYIIRKTFFITSFLLLIYLIFCISTSTFQIILKDDFRYANIISFFKDESILYFFIVLLIIILLYSLISTSKLFNVLGDFISVNILKLFWIITLNRFEFISKSDFKFFWLYHPTSLDVKLNYLYMCVDKYVGQDVIVDRCIIHNIMQPATENLLLIMNKTEISCFANKIVLDSMVTANEMYIPHINAVAAGLVAVSASYCFPEVFNVLSAWVSPLGKLIPSFVIDIIKNLKK